MRATAHLLASACCWAHAPRLGHDLGHLLQQCILVAANGRAAFGQHLRIRAGVELAPLLAADACEPPRGCHRPAQHSSPLQRTLAVRMTAKYCFCGLSMFRRLTRTS
jgi:hypothetical protein